MKLTDLDGRFVAYRPAQPEQGLPEALEFAEPGCSADGVMFLCPKCFASNGGPNVRVRPGERVEVGHPLGLVGDNPADNDGRHLHLEVSPVGRYSPIDPEPFLLT